MPRPSKFTDDTKLLILSVLKVGGSRKTACAVAGIATETLRVWLNRGEAVENMIEELGVEFESSYLDFRREVLAAEAEMPYKALGIVSKKMADNPMLAWKVVERREEGYAPPMPGVHQVAPAVQINLSLGGSARPLPNWIDGEVVDAEEVPAISDGGGSSAAAADADAPTGS